LEGAEIDVRITRITDIKGKANMSFVKIWKISPISPLPPIDHNHNGNSPKAAGDTPADGDKIPPAIEIPQVQDNENRAQNETAGGQVQIR
jgi:hypothetical protein